MKASIETYNTLQITVSLLLYCSGYFMWHRHLCCFKPTSRGLRRRERRGILSYYRILSAVRIHFFCLPRIKGSWNIKRLRKVRTPKRTFVAVKPLKRLKNRRLLMRKRWQTTMEKSTISTPDICNAVGLHKRRRHAFEKSFWFKGCEVLQLGIGCLEDKEEQ